MNDYGWNQDKVLFVLIWLKLRNTSLSLLEK